LQIERGGCVAYPTGESNGDSERADLVEQALGAEAVADQLRERLIDRVVPRGEPRPE
jgi:hypothetical protein